MSSVPTPAIETVQALLAVGDLAGAEPALRALHAQSPDDDDVLNALGNVALMREDVAAARVWFESALGRNPLRADTLCNLGVAAQTLAEVDVAERYYREALDLAPDLTQAAFQLGTMLAAVRRFDEARTVWWSAFTALVTLGPEPRPLEAVVLLRELQLLDRQAVSVLDALGRAYAALGQDQRARECFSDMARLQPGQAAAAAGFALLRLEIGARAWS